MSDNKIKVVAVDLASWNQGYAVINQEFNIIDVGLNKIHKLRKKDRYQDKFQNKMYQIMDFAKWLHVEYNPDYIFYEVPDWTFGGRGRNERNLTALGEARASFVCGLRSTVDKGLAVESIGARDVQITLEATKGKRGPIKPKVADKVATFYTDVHKATAPSAKKNESKYTWGGKALTYDETDALAIALVAMSRLLNISVKELINE